MATVPTECHVVPTVTKFKYTVYLDHLREPYPHPKSTVEHREKRKLMRSWNPIQSQREEQKS